MKLHAFSWTLALALAAAPAFASARMNTAQRLMGDMHENAIKATDDASVAATFSAADGMDWQGYLPYLQGLKTTINAMGDDYGHLKAMPEMETPAARQALRKIGPLLKNVALQTDKATEFFNSHRDTLWQPQYVSQLKSIADENARIAELLQDARQLSTIRSREATLRHDLSTPVSH